MTLFTVGLAGTMYGMFNMWVSSPSPLLARTGI